MNILLIEVTAVFILISLILFISLKIVLARIRHKKIVNKFWKYYSYRQQELLGIEKWIAIKMDELLFGNKRLSFIRSEMRVLSMYNLIYPRNNFWIGENFDSMELEELILEIESNYKIVLESGSFNEMTTISDLAKAIELKLPNKSIHRTAK